MTAAGDVRRGRFIVFEGGDGTGKSTQAVRLAAALGALLTREPGGTPIAERMRELWLDPASAAMVDRSEALLIAAARAQHVAEVIRPTLASGRHVVSDRFAHSSIVYQGYGRGLDPAEVRRVNDWAVEGLWPDLVVLLRVSDEVARARLGERTDALDRVEAIGGGFHARVRDAFEELAAADPEHWVVLDGSAGVEQTAVTVAAAVRERLGL